MSTRTRAAVAPIAAVAALLCSAAAQAQPKAVVVTDQLAPAEVVVDLGTYDTSEIAHTAYAMAPDPPVPSAACPGDPAAYSWTRTWSKSDEFGNSTFGAGYEGKLTTTSTTGVNAPDKIQVDGSLRAFGTVFGTDVNMVYGKGMASLTGNTGVASASLSVVGQTIWSDSGSKTLTSTKTFSKTFFSASTWITLGIVPVHFTASVAGQLGYAYDVHTIGNSIDMTFNPWGKAYATASASVDMWVASAGVEGILTLVEVGVPAHGVITLYPTLVQYNVNADVTVKSLNGVINAFAKVPGKKWTMKLASWPPAYDATFPIIHANNCGTDIVHSTCGDNQCSGNETYVNCSADCPAPPPEPDDEGIPPICLKQPWKCPNLP